jgi:hypothetical protein
MEHQGWILVRRGVGTQGPVAVRCRDMVTIGQWRRVLAWVGLICLLGAGSCGLLESEVKPPSMEKAMATRQKQEAEWQHLAAAYQRYQQNGLAAAEQLLEQGQPTLREEVLLQDLRASHTDAAYLLQHYEDRYLARDDARSAYLLSRLKRVKAERKSLLEVARKKDPDLLQAKVDLLALEPFRVGNHEVLDRLLKLLKQDPGLAEGWRLLRDIGPLYGRNGLACLAADLEPWSTHEGSYEAQLDQVRTRLANGQALMALERLEQFGLQSKEARFFEAAALTQLERGQEAWVLLQSMQEQWPQDPMIHFNLAIVARDFMGQPQLAAEELEVFLQLADEPAVGVEPVPYFRKVQAWTWLKEHREGK